MRNLMLEASVPLVLLAVTAIPLTGCAKSRAELLRDRSTLVERKLLSERDLVLGDPGAADRDSRMSHLQTLRVGLSMVNVSIVSVPFLLTTDKEQAIGYGVLDEALATIDWNIPIYNSTSSSAQRPYPALFSPQTGLDIAGIRRGNTPPGITR